jgi:hypothetical protein
MMFLTRCRRDSDKESDSDAGEYEDEYDEEGYLNDKDRDQYDFVSMCIGFAHCLSFRLAQLPLVERERILAERFEKRQLMRERWERQRMLRGQKGTPCAGRFDVLSSYDPMLCTRSSCALYLCLAVTL